MKTGDMEKNWEASLEKSGTRHLLLLYKDVNSFHMHSCYTRHPSQLLSMSTSFKVVFVFSLLDQLLQCGLGMSGIYYAGFQCY